MHTHSARLRTLLTLGFVLLCVGQVWVVSAHAAPVLSAFEDPASGLWGYRDARGAVVIEPRFLVAQDFSAHGIAAVADAVGWKIIDQRGAVLIPQPYLVDNGPDPFQEGLARFVEGGRIGFFDREINRCSQNSHCAGCIMPALDQSGNGRLIRGRRDHVRAGEQKISMHLAQRVRICFHQCR